jgi:hypothetical protein
MLTACASSPPAQHLAPSATDPVVTTQVKTRTVCPAELDQPTAARPTPAPDARVSTNPSGSAFIAALSSWGDGNARQLDDARTACHAAQTKEAASAQ